MLGSRTQLPLSMDVDFTDAEVALRSINAGLSPALVALSLHKLMCFLTVLGISTTGETVSPCGLGVSIKLLAGIEPASPNRGGFP